MQDNRPTTAGSLSQFLISIGIVLINIYIFNMFSQWICIRWFHTDPELLISNHLFDDLTMQQKNALRFSQAFTSFGGFIMSSLVILQVFQLKPQTALYLNRIPSPKISIISLVLFFSMVPLVQQLLYWNDLLIPEKTGAYFQIFRELEDQNNRLIEILLSGSSIGILILNLVALALIPAIGEEFFFRGILFRIFENWTGKPHLAVWLTSILFAIIHFQVFKIIPMAILAAIFGYLLFFTRSLWLGIILHFVNNATVVLAYALKERGMSYAWLEADFTFSTLVLCISTVLAAASFYYLFRNKITLEK